MNKLLIANWKMNPETLREAVRLARAEDLSGVVVAPPFVYLESAGKALRNAHLGAQDVSLSEPRAVTGEISPVMLKNLGVKFVIVGHSERRALGETDEMINKKVIAALKAGLKVVLCVGEPSRPMTRTKNYVKNQLEKDLAGLLKLKAKSSKLIIAYEPVWAIGTGTPDNPKTAAEMISYIKKLLKAKSLKLKAVKVLYGGSVTAKNSAGFFKRPEIDGALVGGASLNAKEFRKIWGNCFIKYGRV
ncbi:triose-phosphate isomerase [Candidatus Wolfebacteria bacterium RIFCSPLOWO2_01_FULL_45_19]|uniref:Triosephosphate isomerase n=1 Tax=Candidatus Wolfebacteria bacterium RIFCSPLOWO2_01_FULL_45_19 TaxID=1802557 RepID=A0A1F8DSC9_9BACT|nr:MAG: Triosephosphate isomerase [Parcubacteria group bacterium GW2011_GWB1_45_9]OGM91537.1 MAG: triose-phosphate isomerase [Candidatus Wolfebacteria bacterium RIFCSPLOWO2_01_FULL_45_19]